MIPEPYKVQCQWKGEETWTTEADFASEHSARDYMEALESITPDVNWRIVKQVETVEKEKARKSI